jgi:hypothetical protein
MSLVRTLLKKNGVAFDDFWAWAETASKGNHKRLFDSYEHALQDIEQASAGYDLWLRRSWQKDDFEAGKTNWEERQKRLKKRAMVRLERIFRTYKESQ